MRTLILAFVALMSLLTSPLEAQKIGNFEYESDVDAFDDTDRSFIIAPDATRSSALGVKCMANGPTVLIMHKYLGGDRDNEVLVRYRFDQEPPSEVKYWDLIDTSRGSFLPTSDTGAFLSAMRRSSRVVVRITDPLDDETITMTFDLNGASTALSRLSCVRNFTPDAFSGASGYQS